MKNAVCVNPTTLLGLLGGHGDRGTSPGVLVCIALAVDAKVEVWAVPRLVGRGRLDVTQVLALLDHLPRCGCAVDMPVNNLHATRLLYGALGVIGVAQTGAVVLDSS